MRPASCVLLDFGDTLAREDFLLRAPPESPDWREIVGSAIYDPPARILDAWMVGDLSVHDVAAHLSPLTGLPEARVRAILEANCRAVQFFDGMLEAVSRLRRSGLRTAIVTLNADVFRDIVVPHHGLGTLVDTIVSSHEVRSLNKVRLCEIALQRLDEADCGRAVLIDNLLENVRDFGAWGGQGFHFRGAPAFLAALRGGRVPGLAHISGY